MDASCCAELPSLRLLASFAMFSSFTRRAASDLLTHSPVSELHCEDELVPLGKAGSEMHSVIKGDGEGGKEACRSSTDRKLFSDGAGSKTAGSLMDLEGEILAKLWPAERVVCGQLACKFLRLELRKCRRVLLTARNNCSVLDLALANFAQYHGADVSLSLVSKSQHKVLFAVLCRDSSMSSWPGTEILPVLRMHKKCVGEFIPICALALVCIWAHPCALSACFEGQCGESCMHE